MDLLALDKLRAKIFAAPENRSVVAVRLTCTLAPEVCPLAHHQDDPYAVDALETGGRKLLRCPSDAAPAKAAPEVLVVGRAFAPHATPVPSVVVRVQVGSVDKLVEVVGDRTFDPATGEVSPPKRFSGLPIGWDRTFGGPDTPNPAGVPFEPGSALRGKQVVPSLVLPGQPLDKVDGYWGPVGLGPIAPHWPSRRLRLGRAELQHVLEAKLLPEDIGFWNAAPEDQWLDEIRPDEPLVLEHLHPEHPRLWTRLPGVRPHAVIRRPARPDVELPLVADTLWIDTVRGVVGVTWRGTLSSPPGEAGQVIVTAGAPSEPTELSKRIGAVYTVVEELTEDLPPDAIMPATPSGLPTPPPPPPPPPSPETAQATTQNLPAVQVRALAASLPFAGAPPPLASTEPAPPSPWAAPRAPVPPPPAATPAPAGTASTTSGARASPPSEPGAERAPRTPSTPRGVKEASDAAAGQEERRPVMRGTSTPTAAATPAVTVRLVASDPRAVEEARRAFRRIMTEHDLRPGRVPDDDAPPAEREAQSRLSEILARATPVDLAGLRARVHAASFDGALLPPVVVVHGELVLTFDDAERLRAMLAWLTPFATADKRLKEACAAAAEVLGSPYATALAPTQVGRLREAFVAQARTLPADHLDAQVERMLVSRRAFDVRDVGAGRSVRSLFVQGSDQIPIYLGEAMARDLPSFAKLRVRALVEVDLRLDEAEIHPLALRALAVGRLTDTGTS